MWFYGLHRIYNFLNFSDSKPHRDVPRLLAVLGANAIRRAMEDGRWAWKPGACRMLNLQMFTSDSSYTNTRISTPLGNILTRSHKHWRGIIIFANTSTVLINLPYYCCRLDHDAHDGIAMTTCLTWWNGDVHGRISGDKKTMSTTQRLLQHITLVDQWSKVIVFIGIPRLV